MSEKNQQVYPLAPATRQPRSDEESANPQSKEFRRKRRIKCCAYIVAFAVFQTIIILVFALTVMRIKTPKVRLGTVTVNELFHGNQASPYFNMSFSTQITVKNTNFGHYKFDNSTATFTYEGMSVGQVGIPKARARARSTKKLDVTVNLNSNGLSRIGNLGSDISSGFLKLKSQAKLNGKVHLMKVIKKKKSADMDCTMTITLSTNAVQMVCK